MFVHVGGGFIGKTNIGNSNSEQTRSGFIGENNLEQSP